MLQLPDFLQWKELVETHVLLYSLPEILTSDKANKEYSREFGYQITSQFMMNSLDPNTIIMILRSGLAGDVKGIWDYVIELHQDRDQVRSRVLDDLNELLFTGYTPLTESPKNYVNRFNKFALTSGSNLSDYDHYNLFVDNLSAAPDVRSKLLNHCGRPTSQNLIAVEKAFLDISQA